VPYDGLTPSCYKLTVKSVMDTKQTAQAVSKEKHLVGK
jgi:hypothetical protein